MSGKKERDKEKIENFKEVTPLLKLIKKTKKEGKEGKEGKEDEKQYLYHVHPVVRYLKSCSHVCNQLVVLYDRLLSQRQRRLHKIRLFGINLHLRYRRQICKRVVFFLFV